MPGRARKALTQKFVDRVAATGTPQQFGDAACAGLRLWVGKNGTKRWQRRDGDKTMILGDATAITLTAARAMCNGPVVVAAPRAARTVGAFLDRYVEDRRRDWTPRTYRQAPRVLRRVLEPLLDRPLTDITRHWTRDRQEELMAGGIAASTVTVYTKHLAAFVRWCYENEHLDANPYRQRLKPLPVESTAKAVTERDKYLIEEQCAVDNDLAMACCVMLALNCGLRRDETQTRRLRDIRLDQGIVYVSAANSKGGKPREAPLEPGMVAFLRERLPKLRQDFPFKVGDFGPQWHGLQKRARLYDTYRFHDLRHGFGSLAMGRGADVKTVSEMMGHSSTAVTEGYLHSNAARHRQVAKLMAGRWQGRPYLPAPLPGEDGAD